MADIFDQISPDEAPAQGDIFDQVAAKAQPETPGLLEKTGQLAGALGRGALDVARVPASIGWGLISPLTEAITATSPYQQQEAEKIGQALAPQSAAGKAILKGVSYPYTKTQELEQKGLEKIGVPPEISPLASQLTAVGTLAGLGELGGKAVKVAKGGDIFDKVAPAVEKTTEIKEADIPQFLKDQGFDYKGAYPPMKSSPEPLHLFNAPGVEGTTFTRKTSEINTPEKLLNVINEKRLAYHLPPVDTLDQLKSQKGGVPTEMLVPPEAEAAAKAVTGAAKEIKDAFAPAAAGKAAQTTAEAIRENLGTRVQAMDRVHASLDQAHDYMDKLGPDANWAFYDAMEKGRPQPTKELTQIASSIRNILDSRQEQLIKHGKLDEFNENYMPHIYEFSTGQKIKNLLSGVPGGRGIKGASKFLLQRKYDTIGDAMANGLKPVSNNALDLVFLRAQQIDKYLSGLDTVKELKDKGIAKFFKDPSKVPDGWVKIVDPLGSVTYRNAAHELVTSGHYYMPADGAKIIENYLSPGLRGSQLFRAYRGFNNLLNNFQLGFSFFHLGFTSYDTMVSKFALALDHIAHGEIGKAIKAGNPASILTAPGLTAVKGHEVMKAWYDPKYGDPMLQQITKALAMGGGRVKWDQVYRTQLTNKMMQAFHSGNPLSMLMGGVGRAPFAAMEQMSRPMMEYLVPRQKLGVAYDLLRAEIERNPNMTHDQMRTVATKVWNSVDNRMGQLVYDNLFWNNAYKDLGFASVRSLGWNIGTIRELAGGGVDSLKQLGKVAKGQKPELTYRMGYTLALPLVMGLFGGITHYLMTGQRPQELKDYFFPKTGRLDDKGREERLSYPSYIRDIAAFHEHPVSTVGHKAAPALNLLSEMLMNQDFYGGKIFNENDPLVKEAHDIVRFGAQSFLPMGVRQAQLEMQRGVKGPELALPFIGITPAPAYLTETDRAKLVRGLKETRADFKGKMRRAKTDSERNQVLMDYQESMQNLGRQLNASKNR